MRFWLAASMLVSPLVGCSDAARAEDAVVARVGAPAPDFTLTDLDGRTHTLSASKGKVVVLEWFNPGCPFVQHAHGAGGPLADLAARSTAQDVVWFAINSGAPGKQGHGVDVNRQAAETWKLSHPILIDEDGAVGHRYGAGTTPQMVVIDAAGNVVYTGAIDNRPLGKGDGAPVNHVEKALADLAAGRPVATPETKPYGCSVKY